MKGEKRRYALLLAARDSDYVRQMYGGYRNVFLDAYGEEGEEGGERWDVFRVIDGEFPDAAELRRYYGFVVSGSPNDAYGNEFWVLKLCLLLQTAHAMRKRILGICFGHQIVCRALGGKVGKAHRGWDIGIRKVRLVEDLPPSRFLSGLKKEMPSSASIIEIHRDEVWEVPSGAEVIAFSEQTSVEAFAVGDLVLGIQGHPEYSKDILYSLIDRLVDDNCIEGDFAEDVKARVEAAEPDRKFWQKICKSFLRGER